MLRRAVRLLPELCLLTQKASANELACCSIASARGFKAVADVEINFNDRETLKKYVGVRDHLSKEHGTKVRRQSRVLFMAEAGYLGGGGGAQCCWGVVQVMVVVVVERD